jgi:GNAT superfamily N-acetyltransferase
MSAEEILESNRQWIDWAKRRAEALPGSEIRELPGLTVAWGGGPVWLTNSVFLSRPVENAADFEERTDSLADFLGTKPDPPFLVICLDWIEPALRDFAFAALAAHGFRAGSRSTGMRCDELPAPELPLPELSYHPIGDQETQNIAADINSLAHGFRVADGRAAMARSPGWGEELWGCLAYHDGGAVATCAALRLNGCLHILRLATLPGMQRRRFGEAALRRALEMASQATGLTRTTLHSTAAGDVLYRRLGYRAVAQFLTFRRE